jgi:hypothetical protein
MAVQLKADRLAASRLNKVLPTAAPEIVAAQTALKKAEAEAERIMSEKFSVLESLINAALAFGRANKKIARLESFQATDEQLEAAGKEVFNLLLAHEESPCVNSESKLEAAIRGLTIRTIIAPHIGAAIAPLAELRDTARKELLELAEKHAVNISTFLSELRREPEYAEQLIAVDFSGLCCN